MTLFSITKSVHGMPSIRLSKFFEGPTASEVLYAVSTSQRWGIPHLTVIAVQPFVQLNTDDEIMVELWSGDSADHQNFIDYLHETYYAQSY